MRVVKDETELPAPETNGATWYYLRLKYEPELVIHGQTGELFAREDGQKWQEEAYWFGMQDDKPWRRIGYARLGNDRKRFTAAA